VEGIYKVQVWIIKDALWFEPKTIGHIRVRYFTDAIIKTVKVEITPTVDPDTKYNHWKDLVPNDADIYLGNELIVENVRQHVGEKFIRESSRGWRSIRYAMNLNFNIAHYWWYYSPTQREKATKIFWLIKEGGQWGVRGIIHLWKELPEDWICREDLYMECLPHVYSECCGGLVDIPGGWVFHPRSNPPANPSVSHFRRSCVCRCWVIDECAGCPSGYGGGQCNLDPECDATNWYPLYLLMTKGADVEDKYGNTAIDYLIAGWKDACGVTHDGILIPYEENGYKEVEPGLYASRFLSHASILGYGYGNDRAKKIADKIAETYLKIQWGVDETLGIDCGYNYEGTLVYRPEHTGGFLRNFKIMGKKYVPGLPTKESLQRQAMDYFGWQHPPERKFFIPTYDETTVGRLADLVVYEYYKWRGGAGKGSPKPIPPRRYAWLAREDVNLDGKVDIADLARVSRYFGTGEPKWYPQECDFNGDGRVDILDVAHIGKAFGTQQWDSPPVTITVTPQTKMQTSKMTQMATIAVAGATAVMLTGEFMKKILFRRAT